MAQVDVLTGVSQVDISQDDTTSIPSLNGVTVTCSTDTPLESLRRSANKAIDTSDTYKVSVALVGRESTKNGYTVGVASAQSSGLTISAAGDSLKVKILNADFPVGMTKAIAVALFLQTNNADPQLAGFGYIDPAEDFVHEIFVKPTQRAPFISNTILTAATAHQILGSRVAKGVTYLPVTPTTGGVRLAHRTSRITIRPDDAPDFDVVTTKATDIQFSALVADNLHLTQNFGGNYIKFSDGGRTIEQAEADLVTATSTLHGNRAIRVFMPPDSNGDATIRLFLGNLDTNQQDVTENTSKTDQLQIDFSLQAAAVDYLTKNLHSTIWFKAY